MNWATNGGAAFTSPGTTFLYAGEEYRYLQLVVAHLIITDGDDGVEVIGKLTNGGTPLNVFVTS